MTNDEIAVSKTKAIVIFGVGVSCFVAAYLTPEDTNLQLAIGIGFVIGGLICMVAAGKIAKSLRAATSAK